MKRSKFSDEQLAEWRKGLKKGDSVRLLRGFTFKQEPYSVSHETVQSISPTGRITVYGYTFNPDGTQRGGSRESDVRIEPFALTPKKEAPNGQQ
jgi:hypothetical protein